MNSMIRAALIFASVLAAGGIVSMRGQDASIDQLIKKLPPPEKAARSVSPLADPALRDPLAKQMVAAGKARNFGSAYNLSRQLAARYPKSPLVQFIPG
jgi:hypothetical protein